MQSFNVMLLDFRGKLYSHDIMPFLISYFKQCEKENWWYPSDKKPKTQAEFIAWVSAVLKYEYWARCEYEFLIMSWPPGDTDTYEGCKKIIDSSIKIDAWDQIKQNLDIVVNIFMNNIK